MENRAEVASYPSWCEVTVMGLQWDIELRPPTMPAGMPALPGSLGDLVTDVRAMLEYQAGGRPQIGIYGERAFMRTDPEALVNTVAALCKWPDGDDWEAE